jgi:hypothetical protein
LQLINLNYNNLTTLPFESLKLKNINRIMLCNNDLRTFSYGFNEWLSNGVIRI